MKKEQVFVVIDTEKKAKKVAVLLHMFRQYESGYHTLRKCLSEQACLCYDVKCDYWYWNYYDDAIDFRKEVSVSELKQILAMEHLKKCDSIICSFNNVKYIASFREFENGRIYCNRWYCIESEEIFEIRSYFTKFHRYATEEEKQLLNPIAKEDEKHTGSFESLRKCDTVDFPSDFKEVEKQIKDPIKGIWRYIGKQDWNRLHEFDALIFDNGNDESFGFNHSDKVTSTYSLKTALNTGLVTRVAPQKEVAERYLKEVKKRYPNHKGFSFNHTTNEITTGGEIVFKNGTWLEAKKIEIDPLKELKEAHKKGFEIEYKSSSGQWKTSSNPAWRKTGNYRIRTVKIGDWFLTTHEQTNVKYYYQINETNINDVRGNHVRIKDQMVIDILNNGKYTV